MVHAGFEQFEACIDHATIPDGPVRARVEAIVDAGWEAYGGQLGRASFEVLINTRASRESDPDHAAQLVEMTRGLHRIRKRLLAGRDSTKRGRAVDALIWAALRGFAMTLMSSPDGYDFAAEREALIDVLTMFIEAQDAARLSAGDRST
jgi:hypothetical protein